jgi:hypothetical protein
VISYLDLSHHRPGKGHNLSRRVVHDRDSRCHWSGYPLAGGVGVTSRRDEAAVEAGEVVILQKVLAVTLVRGVEGLDADDGNANADLTGVEVLVQKQHLEEANIKT